MSELSDGDALMTLLTVQGLLLAALGLLASLGTTTDPNLSNLRVYSGRIIWWVGLALLFTGVGAAAAWASVFTGGQFEGVLRAVEAGGIAVASPAVTWVGWIVVRHGA